MKILIKLLLLITLFFILGYFFLGYLSSYFGWYGYKKWEYRVATSSIAESKRRGVFIKELKFKIDSFPGKIEGFRPFIEKGFKYGHHTSEETVPLENSNYPYQLSFNFKATEKMGILVREDQLRKFDSSNNTKGFLKYPELNDTIIVDIIGENIKSGIIRVWEEDIPN